MDKDRLRRLTENPKFIPGIYNYCDRWCERCLFTSRCLNFAIDNENFHTSEQSYSAADEFWDKLKDTFSLTIGPAEDSEQEELDDLTISDELIKETEHHNRAKNHVCAIAAEYYTKKIRDWFIRSDIFFNDQQNLLRAKIHLDPVQTIKDAAALKDAIEVINWYQNQIYVKILRAIHSKMDEEEYNNRMGKDSDGSAKVALIGIERSISAWKEMLNYFQCLSKDINGFILQLELLRKDLENTFPAARSFARPGFDELN